jgi:hypothetical protein
MSLEWLAKVIVESVLTFLPTAVLGPMLSKRQLLDLPLSVLLIIAGIGAVGSTVILQGKEFLLIPAMLLLPVATYQRGLWNKQRDLNFAFRDKALLGVVFMGVLAALGTMVMILYR